MDVVEQMEHEKDLATLRRLLPSVLSDREYQIISMRYGIGRNAHITQREAAQRLGISRSYVSRIEKKALGKLREAFFCAEWAAGQSEKQEKIRITSFKKMGSVL